MDKKMETNIGFRVSQNRECLFGGPINKCFLYIGAYIGVPTFLETTI